MSSEIGNNLIVWGRAIETQMHFAELSIKMRQIGLTLAGATIALAVVLYRTNSDYYFDIFDFRVPIGTVLCVAAAIILLAVKQIDVGVYHRMLRGAVKFNEIHEKYLVEELGWNSGLTETISAYSRFEKPRRLPHRNEAGERWVNDGKKENAEKRINSFYHISIVGLGMAAIGLAIVANYGNIIENASA